jgi:hypothetical protein
MTEIVCPSRLSGRVRGMRVREEKILADRQLAKSGAQLDELLAACWEETTDPGPYVFATGRVDWSKVLQGDRFYALMQMRVATYGADYAFHVSCRNGACRTRIDWEVDLDKLIVRPLCDASRAALLAGNRFEAMLPDAGRRVWFKLLTGEDERKLARAAKHADGALSHVLELRVVEIEGVEARERRRFLEDLTMRDADALFDAFDASDCGVDTTIEIECPECLEVQDVELPFDQGFFLPGKGRSARRRDRQSSSPRSSSTTGARGSSSSSGNRTVEAA